MKKSTNNSLTTGSRQLDVVLMAVYLLDGHKKAVDTEDIAMKAHALAPAMFSWQKYPDQINLELVRVNLSNAKKNQYGELLTGSGREGWRLSSNGLEWVSTQGKPLMDKGFEWKSERRTAGSVDAVRKRREKKRLLDSLAWKSWCNREQITVRDACDLFRIDEYSTGKMLEIKIVRLQSLFEDELEINRFLKDAAKLALKKRR